MNTHWSHWQTNDAWKLEPCCGEMQKKVWKQRGFNNTLSSGASLFLTSCCVLVDGSYKVRSQCIMMHFCSIFFLLHLVAQCANCSLLSGLFLGVGLGLPEYDCIYFEKKKKKKKRNIQERFACLTTKGKVNPFILQLNSLLKPVVPQSFQCDHCCISCQSKYSAVFLVNSFDA